jgi:hypothetical protein
MCRPQCTHATSSACCEMSWPKMSVLRAERGGGADAGSASLFASI